MSNKLARLPNPVGATTAFGTTNPAGGAPEFQHGFSVPRVHQDPPIDELPQHLARLLRVCPE